MRTPSGMKMNWPVVAIVLAVIAVPLAIGMIQDLGSDAPDPLAELRALEEEGEELEEVEEEVGAWKAPAMNRAFFDQVLVGTGGDGPGLRGAMDGLRWGQTELEVAAAAPLLAVWGRGEAPEQFAGAEVELVYGDGTHLSAVRFSFPDDGSAVSILGDRWGEGRIVLGDDGLARHLWFDPAQWLRVVVDARNSEAEVTFSSYVPVDKLIRDDGRFFFETRPIFGQTVPGVAKQYGVLDHLRDRPDGDDKVRIGCPFVELSREATTCTVLFEQGVASEIYVVIDHGLDSDAGPGIFATLRDRLGEVKSQTSDEYANTWTFARGFVITQYASSRQIEIRRSR
jgi:hypothetical protein